MSHGLPTAAPVSFSCSHGQKEKRPPTADDDIGSSRSIEELYKQAASRLPLAEMPELESCVYAGGNCLGLADPVSNIILNAVGLLLQQAKLPSRAAKAEHPAPAVLARIMAAQYPSDALAAVLAKLRRPLTTHDVWEIRDLLARQWPPPVSMEFSYRPNGTTCARRDDGALLLSTYIGEERDFVATILIERTRHHHQLSFISNLTFDNSADMETKLSGCLQWAAALQAAVHVDYDASPCERVVSLKLCLLDAIHAMYIKALAVMPRSPRLLRAVLVTGHCYGPMDPVSNIIANAAFPPVQGAGELPDGVLNTGPMSRVASRSLDGLVAMLRQPVGARGPELPVGLRSRIFLSLLAPFLHPTTHTKPGQSRNPDPKINPPVGPMSSPSTESECLPGGGSLSRFHGEEWKRPPVDEATITGSNEIKRRFIDGFYTEAARRLPLKEVPGLDGCLCAGGLYVGLADPVANIILNAVGLLLHDQQEQLELPSPERKFRVRRGGEGWGDIAYRSLDGLRGFMPAYFRYLGCAQGSRYLYVASQNLPLAIALVRHDRFSSRRRRRRLLPDSGNLSDALRVAAVQAKHPAPGVVARLMTAQYPSGLLAPVVAKLQGTESLTAGDVSAIMDLQARQWPPAPPTVSMEFWCGPNSTTCTRGDERRRWHAATSGDDGTLMISTCTGDGRPATVSIPPPTTTQDHQQQLGCIFDLTFHGADMEDNLSGCLREAAAVTAPQRAAPPVDYDASTCTHVLSPKQCLLDAIYALYIRALAALPSCSPRLLRAHIAGGHCYGPMDPVSNIIVNTIWYDKAFPLITFNYQTASSTPDP
ncbi:uncharacterized protein [Setaria viridis]|uniref:uncharacterized protein n=1 Tax=Setaria viridis TaxID=4556 RepID=UPI003B3AD2B2